MLFHLANIVAGMAIAQVFGQALGGVLVLTRESNTGCSAVRSVQHTFYGWPDNDPASAATAYNCGGRNYIAGGTGSYADPVTMASGVGEFDPCEIIYVPYLKKYVRCEDVCAECDDEWNSAGTFHIDIWTGSATSGGGQDQINCEDQLTPPKTHTIIRNPAQNFEVDDGALYGGAGDCGTSHVYNTFSVSSYCPSK